MGRNRSRHSACSDLDRRIRNAKAVLRDLPDALEELDDRRELARAKKRNAGKAGTDWETVKKERAQSRHLDPIPKSRECRFVLERVSILGYKTLMIIKAIVHKAEEGGFWAEVPSLPGCATQGETLAELEANLREAIDAWLSVDDERRESGVNDQVLELTV